MADIATLHAIIAPEAEALGFDLVRVKLFGGSGDRTLQVMAENPATGQLTIDDCTVLSHRISDKLDALEAEGRDPLKEAYRLEVSSPGIDRPLTRLKDYEQWVGHEARVSLTGPTEAGRKVLTGPILGVDGDRITIGVRKADPVTVGLDQIADAKLVLTDALLAATRPLSSAGADEFETEAPTAGADEEEIEDEDAPESAEDEETN